MAYMNAMNIPARQRLYPALLLAIAGLIAGCGSGGDQSDSQPGLEMEIGVAYSVKANDRIVSTSPEPAEVGIEHDMKTGDREAMLLSGSADLFQ